MAKSEAKFLEQCRVSLDNVSKQPAIQELMSAVGYGPEVIAEGKAYLNEARQAYDTNQLEGYGASEASQAFQWQRQELTAYFRRDRDLAKGAFRYDGPTAARIGVAEGVPKAYLRWVETVRKFYTNTLADPEVMGRLAQLGVTEERLLQGAAMLRSLEEARSSYLKEEGESQDATKAKDAAFERLEDWMRDFYAVAKVALRERPQLAESLGKFVKS